MKLLKYKYFDSSEDFEAWQLDNKLTIRSVIPVTETVVTRILGFRTSRSQYSNKILVIYEHHD